jgi:activator of 2-hydroxyglutaryl-CoA dehydratase
VEPRLTITGGCAKNPGLAVALHRVLRTEIVPLSVDPQLMGALGAAVLARRRAG